MNKQEKFSNLDDVISYIHISPKIALSSLIQSFNDVTNEINFVFLASMLSSFTLQIDTLGLEDNTIQLIEKFFETLATYLNFTPSNFTAIEFKKTLSQDSALLQQWQSIQASYLNHIDFNLPAIYPEQRIAQRILKQYILNNRYEELKYYLLYAKQPELIQSIADMVTIFSELGAATKEASHSLPVDEKPHEKSEESVNTAESNHPASDHEAFTALIGEHGYHPPIGPVPLSPVQLGFF